MRRAAARSAALTMVVSLGLTVAVMPAPAGAAAHRPSPATVVIPNLGAGYAVVSQGPLQASQLAATSPDPTAAAAALTKLSKSGTIATYQRMWQDSSHNNGVQDLMVRFPSAAAATSYRNAVVRALSKGKIESSGPLTGIPGAFRTTFFALTTTQVGVGAAIVMRRGDYVATMSFFSASAASNTQPITPESAQTAAVAQYAAMPRARTTNAPAAAVPAKKDRALGWIALVIGIIAVADLVLIGLRARKRRTLERGSLIG